MRLTIKHDNLRINFGQFSEWRGILFNVELSTEWSCRLRRSHWTSWMSRRCIAFFRGRNAHLTIQFWNADHIFSKINNWTFSLEDHLLWFVNDRTFFLERSKSLPKNVHNNCNKRKSKCNTEYYRWRTCFWHHRRWTGSI